MVLRGPNHARQAKAHAWFSKEKGAGWALHHIAQLAFVRVSSYSSLKHYVSTPDELHKLSEITALPGRTFWVEPPGVMKMNISAGRCIR